jgi:uncharacterized protein YpmS
MGMKSINYLENRKYENMKKTAIWIFLILLVAMFISNPSEIQHRDTLIKTMLANNSLTKKMENRETVNRYIESTLINKVVESLTYRENYYLISLTKVSLEGNSKIIGIGVFGKVYITNEFSQIIKDYKLN